MRRKRPVRDPKLYDVGPDGKAKLLTRGAFAQPFAPGTTGLPSHEVDIDAFGFSNVIAAGNRLRVTFQTSDAPYLRPTANPFAVAVLAGSAVELPGLAAAFAADDRIHPIQFVPIIARHGWGN